MKKGILYGLSHPAWNQYKKMGRTTQTIKKRISNMQTSLLDDIDIIYITNELTDCYFYEYLMKQILKNYRIKPNKEMFNVDNEDIKIIFDFFNELNNQLNDQIKLNNYINLYYPEYFKKRKYYTQDFISLDDEIKSGAHQKFIVNKFLGCKNESSSNSLSNDKPKKKKRKGIYIDTSY
jgi:hypothetical protein